MLESAMKQCHQCEMEMEEELELCPWCHCSADGVYHPRIAPEHPLGLTIASQALIKEVPPARKQFSILWIWMLTLFFAYVFLYFRMFGWNGLPWVIGMSYVVIPFFLMLFGRFRLGAFIFSLPFMIVIIGISWSLTSLTLRVTTDLFFELLKHHPWL